MVPDSNSSLRIPHFKRVPRDKTCMKAKVENCRPLDLATCAWVVLATAVFSCYLDRHTAAQYYAWSLFELVRKRRARTIIYNTIQSPPSIRLVGEGGETFRRPDILLYMVLKGYFLTTRTKCFVMIVNLKHRY